MGVADDTLDKLFWEHRLKHPPKYVGAEPTALAEARERHRRDEERWRQKMELVSVERFDGGYSEHWVAKK